MENITPEKNIKYLVLSTINRLKFLDVSTTDYVWLLQIAIEFYSDKLRGYNMPSLVSEEISVNLANRVWGFPSDFIALSRIAYRTYDKRLWNLSPDDSIDLTEAPTACEIPDYNNDDINAIWNPTFWYGNYFGTAYGSRGGINTNYYRIDYDKRQVVFSESIPVGTGVVEYLSAGRGVCEDTVIPLPYVETFRRYLIWQAFENSADPKKQSMAKDRERQYNEALYDANMLAKSHTADEILNYLYQASSFNLR